MSDLKLDPQRTAIVVIDLQKGIAAIPGGAPHAKLAVIANCARLLAAAVFGLGLIGFGLSRAFWLSMIMVLIAGMGMMQGMAGSNTVMGAPKLCAMVPASRLPKGAMPMKAIV